MATVANRVHSPAQQIGARIGWNLIDAATLDVAMNITP
jgi:hypothetical protein